MTVTIEIDADENVNSGTIEAVNGGEVDFYINIDGGSNHGLIEAGAGGTVHFFQTHDGGGGGGGGGGDQGGNYGTMEAADGGTLIFDGGLDNFDLLEAVNGGTIDLKNGLNNHASLNQVDTVEAIGSDSVTAVTTTITISGDVINDATIEATGFGAQINIANSDSSENAGTIVAEDHGTITLSSVQLENDHGACVEANGGTINFFGGAITNDGTFKSDHQGAIFVDSHTVYNDGTGVFEALSDGLIAFGEGTVYNGVTVSGASGGTIEALHGGSVDFATTTVYNGSSVAGTAGGIILASCGGTVSLSLSCTIYNNNDAGGPGGVIEALRGGTVHIDTSTVFNDDGTIEAIGCGAVVDLFGTDIYGGTLASSDGGVIEATFGRSTLQDVTILGGSVLDAADVGLGGSFALSETTTLAGGGTVTFEGTGEFLLGGDIVASTAGTTLKNFSTIDGSGQIGAADGKLTLDNELGAKIDANEPGFALTIHTGNTVTNAGTLEATTGGPVGVIGNETLKIEDAVDNSGTITSSGAAAVVQIDGDITNESTGQIGAGDDSGNGGTITFGAVTVTNDAGGDIGAQTAGQVTFDHSHVENHGHIGPNGGTVTFDHSVVENDSAPSEDGNGGITADGGGTITFEYSNVCNTANGLIGAQDGASVTFEYSCINNSAGTTSDGDGIAAYNGGSVTFEYCHIDNNGEIRAFTGLDDVGAGTIYIDDSTIDNAGGTISAIGAGDTVQLSDVTICGGDFLTGELGAIEVVASKDGTTLFDGTGHAVGIYGFVQVDAGAALELAGQIDDNGTIDVDGPPQTGADLVIDGTVTLCGSGVVTLDGSGDEITGAGTGTNTLDNKVTVKGAGEIGGGGLIVNNSGEIDADADGTLTLDTGCNVITNTGVLEATVGGTLDIRSDVDNNGGSISAGSTGTVNFDAVCVDNDGTIGANAAAINFNGGHVDNDGTIVADDGVITFCGTSVDNCGGTIQTDGPDAVVDLVGATIVGGTINPEDDFVIEAVSGVNIFRDVTLAMSSNDGSTIKVDVGATLKLQGTTTIDGSASLTGGGVVTLDCASDEIVGSSDGGTLINQTTIEGAGTISDLTLINNALGIIDANLSCDTLIIDTGHTVANTGVLEATCGGTLEIDDSVNNYGATPGIIKASNGGAIIFNGCAINGASAPSSGGTIEALTCGTIRFNSTNIYNQGSSIEADGVGAMIMLAGAMILGGTLETCASGIIETVADTGTTTLDGVTIATGSTIQVDDGTSLTLQDTADDNAAVTNDGTITLVQGCDPSLIVNGDITLAGSGTVVLSGDTDSIVGNKGTDTLSSANTIEGAGTIGGEGLIFSNLAGGVVDADVSGHTLVLDTGATVTNLGTLEATNGGTLEIDDNVCNVGGTIAAYGCGSVVELEGVTIKGGMFLTDDSTSGDRGVIEVVSTDSATVFDGGSSHAISIGGFVQVDAGATLKLIGTIDLAAHGYNGTIDLAQISTVSGDVGADLVICGTVTLTGSGGITMQGHAAQITAAAPGAALDNGSTISGAGSIGTGNDWLHLVNETAGVINADNASADSLTIDIGCNTIVNQGLLEATGGGTLDIVSHVDNACGSLLATSGGVLDVQSCISGGTATIHGATLEFGAASNVNVTFDNGSGTDYGTLVLDDAAHFTGQIHGFDGTAAGAGNSDTVELTGFCETSYSVQCSGDNEILTLHDGDRCVTLTFDDFNQSFKFEVVGGNTYIYDPPTTGATDAPATATAAPGNDHVAASASQNGTDHAASPATEAGFGSDQDLAAAATAPAGAPATPANQLALAGDTVTAPPSAASAPGDSDVAAFGSDHVAVPPAGPAPGSTLSAGAIQVSTGASQIAIVVPGAPVLDSEHLTDFDDRRRIGCPRQRGHVFARQRHPPTSTSWRKRPSRRPRRPPRRRRSHRRRSAGRATTVSPSTRISAAIRHRTRPLTRTSSPTTTFKSPARRSLR